jgi:two-component system sensor histidine kinase VanS
VLVSTVGTSDHAALAVVNTGAEIAPEVVATLVEPFVRGAGRVTRASGPTGSGLGLALVDAIVRTHAGELQVSPRDGGGLQVRALLPR